MWVLQLSKRDCGKLRPRSNIDDVSPVTSRTSPSPFQHATLKGQGRAWGRGYLPCVLTNSGKWHHTYAAIPTLFTIYLIVFILVFVIFV